MKVIFLDIDGVLVTSRTLKERFGLRSIANPSCVAALNHITDSTGAKIVISSAWRFCGLEEMKLILSYWGITGDVISVTPDLTRKVLGVYSAVPRSHEIREWMYKETAVLDNWVILDDGGDLDGYLNRLVQTEFEEGLTMAQAEEAINLLK